MNSIRTRQNPGYILLEVVMAVAIFALAMVGLFKVLQVSMQTSNEFAQQTAVRYGLQSILTEARHRSLESMALDRIDEDLEITYRTEVEQLNLTNEQGGSLQGLYKLTATASYSSPFGETTETAELWIYENSDEDDQ